MNYYNEIKNKIIDNEIYNKAKDYYLNWDNYICYCLMKKSHHWCDNWDASFIGLMIEFLELLIF